MKIEISPQKKKEEPALTLGMLRAGESFVFIGSEDMPVIKTCLGYFFLSDGSGQLESASNDVRPVRRCVAKVVVESIE